MRPPIDIIHLFPPLNDKLISFLKSLSIDDWHKQTVAGQWRIKDVAAHLLDGNYRQLSLKRDKWSIQSDIPVHSNTELVNYLNRLNADWVKAAWRLSPFILIESLEKTNEEVYKLLSSLDPFAPSVYPVSWAGERISCNWFDMAREYTERWLHQQQIREAMGDKGIMTREFYHPMLHTFMQAWPFACTGTEAEKDTLLKVLVTGDGGGEWFLLKTKDSWILTGDSGRKTAAETTIGGDIAWKLFSKSVRKENIAGSYTISGDQRLGEMVLNMVSVMA